MQSFAEALNAYTRNHPFDAGNGDAETVLDQLYQSYSESHESDPPEISEGFKELECFLESLPLSDNNAVFNLCCRLYTKSIICSSSASCKRRIIILLRQSLATIALKPST